VAAGRVDAFWEERLEAWDMMAAILMIEEAGGRATRFDGSALGLHGDEVVASNGLLHPAMLAVLRGSPPAPSS
jgi:myo-inositol-1(or 4)-monophosphatase